MKIHETITLRGFWLYFLESRLFIMCPHLMQSPNGRGKEEWDDGRNGIFGGGGKVSTTSFRNIVIIIWPFAAYVNVTFRLARYWSMRDLQTRKHSSTPAEGRCAGPKREPQRIAPLRASAGYSSENGNTSGKIRGHIFGIENVLAIAVAEVCF